MVSLSLNISTWEYKIPPEFIPPFQREGDGGLPLLYIKNSPAHSIYLHLVKDVVFS